MLRKNKSLIFKAVLFLAALIVGGVFLWNSRDGNGNISYQEESSDAYQTTQTPTPPGRQPITTLTEALTCSCLDLYMHPIRTLSPPRQPHRAVQIEAFIPINSSYLLLETDGSLWGWGSNWNGQLGCDNQHVIHTPKQILDSVLYVAPGGQFAIREGGELWGWGFDSGDFIHSPWLDPDTSAAPAFIADNVSAIIPGSFRFFYITTYGGLWALGPRQRPHSEPWAGVFAPVATADMTPVYIMEHVTEVIQTRNFDFALQCNGRLWSIHQDSPMHVMDEVIGIFPPNDMIFGEPARNLYVIQSDNSMWSIYMPSAGPLHSPIFVMDNVASIYRSSDSTHIFHTDGSLWAMGNNSMGRLGDGTTAHRSEPVRVLDNAVSVHTFGDSTFAITADNNLWAWGDNMAGQLGLGEAGSRQTYPELVMGGVRSIHSSFDHSFSARYYALGTDNSLWTWGRGLILYPDKDEALIFDGFGTSSYTPVRAMEDIVAVYPSQISGFAIDTQGGLWEWGQGASMGLFWPGSFHFYSSSFTPHGFTQAIDNSPRLILNSVASIYMDWNNVFAIQTNGRLWGWGLGPIGDSTQAHRLNPVNLSFAFSYGLGGSPPQLGYVSVQPSLHEHPQRPFLISGGRTYFFVDVDASLWSWGDNWGNQLGRGLSPYDWEGALIPGHVMDDVAYVHSQNEITHALGQDGRLWVWGFSHGDTPQYVMSDVTAFYGDNFNYFALKTDGSLWSWNENPGLYYGIGRSAPHLRIEGYPPGALRQPVEIMSDVRSFHMDNGSFFAVKNDGTLWSWGHNHMGVLGDGTPGAWPSWDPWAPMMPHADENARLYPLQIMENVAVFHIEGHSAFALQTDGNLWAWGDNRHGQIGDESRKNTYAPVHVMDGVDSIFTNGASVFAQRLDNSLWAWGNNILGQLGDGTRVTRLSPTVILPESMVTTRIIYFYDETIFAIREDHSLSAWGVGFGPSPVHVRPGIGTVLRDNNNQMFALQPNGSLWCINGRPFEHTVIAEDVAALHQSWDRNFAIKTNGELWYWRSRDWFDWMSSEWIVIESNTMSQIYLER